MEFKDEFFDWLNECPVQWFLNETDKESRSYTFIQQEE